MSRIVTFDRLKWGSFAHSAVYLALLVNWLVLDLDGPRPWLGFAHGVGWIAMSLAAVSALRLRVIDLRLAVAVAVLGGVGPFFGTAEFVRRSRRRGALESTGDGSRHDDPGRDAAAGGVGLRGDRARVAQAGGRAGRGR